MLNETLLRVISLKLQITLAMKIVSALFVQGLMNSLNPSDETFAAAPAQWR